MKIKYFLVVLVVLFIGFCFFYGYKPTETWPWDWEEVEVNDYNWDQGASFKGDPNAGRYVYF